MTPTPPKPHTPPAPEQTNLTTRLLQQILDVSQENLGVSKEAVDILKLTLEVEQESRDLLKVIAAAIAGFSHQYTVQVEQVLLAKPNPGKKGV